MDDRLNNRHVPPPAPESARNRRRSRLEIGRAAEEVAAQYLLERGYRLLARNWRCRLGEIDLIAEQGATLVVAEVRARTHSPHFGAAVEAVNPRKCRQVREVASLYLKQLHQRQQRHTPSVSIRFDVVAITFNRDGTVIDLRHLEGAF